MVIRTAETPLFGDVVTGIGNFWHYQSLAGTTADGDTITADTTSVTADFA